MFNKIFGKTPCSLIIVSLNHIVCGGEGGMIIKVYSLLYFKTIFVLQMRFV